MKPDAAGCLPVEQILAVQREEIERCITDEMKVDGNLCKQGERESARERHERVLVICQFSAKMELIFLKR